MQIYNYICSCIFKLAMNGGTSCQQTYLTSHPPPLLLPLKEYQDMMMKQRFEALETRTCYLLYFIYSILQNSFQRWCDLCRILTNQIRFPFRLLKHSRYIFYFARAIKMCRSRRRHWTHRCDKYAFVFFFIYVS